MEILTFFKGRLMGQDHQGMEADEGQPPIEERHGERRRERLPVRGRLAAGSRARPRARSGAARCRSAAGSGPAPW